MTPEKALESVLKTSQKLYKINRDGEPYFERVPEYYEGYKRAVKQRKRIEVHAVVDVFPDELVKHRAPNQSDVEFEYVKHNWKNTTHPVFVDYLSVVTTGLNDHNWEIEYPENSDDYVTYIHNGIKGFSSIENFVKKIIPTTKAKDPNGVMTFYVEPKYIEVNGELRIDDTQKLAPQPIYYKCDNVVGWSEYWAMFESHERSIVEYNGKAMEVGRVFYYYDETTIWKIEQVGKFIDARFEINPIFFHELGYLPCHKLKGVPEILSDGRIYYTSPFYYSVDLLDWSLLYSNYLNVSVANSAFPFRVMVGDVCDFVGEQGRCIDGNLIGNEGGLLGKCPNCHGNGLKARVSPMGTYLLKPKMGADDGDTSFAKPVEYVSPTREILDFVKELAKQYFYDAKSILHIHTSNSNVKGSEDMTATGMSIDQKAKFAFVQPISDQDFDIFQFYLDLFGKLREGNEFEGAKLTYPKTFDFLTAEDILNDIESARAANAPDIVLHALIYQFVANRFSSDGQMAKVFELIVAADRLLALSKDEIIQRKAQGLIENWEIALHDSGIKFINDLITQDPKFLGLELEQQIPLLEAKAKATVPNTTLTKAQELQSRLLGA